MDFKERFVADRARALVMVLLTRREDLVVTERKEDYGLDYIVSIRSEEGVGERSFGVLMRATMTPVTIDNANKQLKPTMANVRMKGPFIYPVCIFYFTVKDDKGYYTWAYEPVVGKDGTPALRYRSEAHCHVLDDGSLGALIEKVNHWYDAYFTKMVS
jgi:hypothetical protein